MAVTPAQLLEHAKSLASGDELSIRVTINRAYYAVHHAARLFHDGLAAPGRLPERGVGVHESLYHQLLNPTISDEETKFLSRKVGIKAKDLKAKRELADYFIDLSVTEADAQYVLVGAESTFQLLKQA
jgi:uncharacterized protein (UPF0332 family)